MIRYTKQHLLHLKETWIVYTNAIAYQPEFGTTV
jgi:hypothetical protein